MKCAENIQTQFDLLSLDRNVVFLSAYTVYGWGRDAPPNPTHQLSAVQYVFEP